MKKLFTLVNHNLTPEQIKEAKEVLKITKIIDLHDESWIRVPPQEKSVLHLVQKHIDTLKKEAEEGDYLFVQGDFGATHIMVSVAFKLGLKPIYATTQRKATEILEEGKIVIKREFMHIRFREYEEIDFAK